METVNHSIYEKENYWRDGAETGGHGEWMPYAAINLLVRKVFGGERLLDLGCGCGPFLQWGNPDANFGMEISKYALQHPLPGAEGKMIYGTIEDIPFKDNFFGIVTAFNVMEHIDPYKRENILSEIFRISFKWVILAICLSTDYKPEMEYEYAKDSNLAEYTDRQQHEIKRGHWCVHPREWWIDKVGTRGFIREDMEKQILDFTSKILPETDPMWTYNSKGLLVFEKNTNPPA